MQFPSGFLGKLLFAWMTPKTIAHARWTADLLDIQPEDRIIEVGFGNGANIKLLLERAVRGSVTGAEISRTAIEMASSLKETAELAARVSDEMFGI